MNIDELFPSRYLRPADLSGREFHVTIANVRLEQVHVARSHRDEVKPVLYLERARKGLILSAHNAHTISGLHGPETDDWSGKRITLFVQPGVEAFGQVYDVVRVQPAVPPASAENSSDGTLPLEEDEVDAGLIEELDDENELDQEPTGEVAELGRAAMAEPGSAAARAGRWCGEGRDRGEVPGEETASRLRADCLALIAGFAEEEREELRRALDGLEEAAELRRLRRYLQDERHEAAAEAEAERRGARESGLRRMSVDRGPVVESRRETGRVHHG